MRLLTLAVLLAAACAGGNHEFHASTNPDATFDRYRTFSFGESDGAPLGFETSARSTEVRRRVQPLIANALTQKGYLEVATKGSLVLSFGTGQRTVPVRKWSTAASGWLPAEDNEDMEEGALVIDVIDSANNNRVWHGATRATVNPDRIDSPRLQRSVQSLFSSFPAAKPQVASAE